MKRPLAAVVSFYAAGLLLAEFVQPPLPALFSLTFALLAFAIFFFRIRSWLIWPLLLLVGWVNLNCRTAVLSPQDLRVKLSDAPEQVIVRGKLCETPSQRLYVRDETESWRTLARLDVTALACGTNWQAARGQIMVTTTGSLPTEFFAGEEVEIGGIIAPPPLPAAEGLFDYRNYMRRQGIYFQLKALSIGDWKLLSTNAAPPWSDRFLAWSQQTLARGLPEVDEPLKLLWAMTLGWKTALTSEVTAPFGASHRAHRGNSRGNFARGATAAFLVRCGHHSAHLVLHGGHRLAAVRHPLDDHDDHHHRRLGVETAKQPHQFACRRRVHHPALRPAAIVPGELSAFVLRRVEHRAVYAAAGKTPRPFAAN
jgi:hypothetical protein